MASHLHGSAAVAELKHDSANLIDWESAHLHGSAAVAELKRFPGPPLDIDRDFRISTAPQPWPN